MDVLCVIFVVIMYVGTIFFILIKEEKQYNKLIQEYNKLVDVYNLLKRGYTFQNSLIEYYECKLKELLKTLRELNNLSLDHIKNDE